MYTNVYQTIQISATKAGLRLENFSKLRSQCAQHGLCVADVPADGNCLIWTLKQLFFGVKKAQLIPSQAEKIVCHHMRLELKAAWIACSTGLYWQQLFSELIEKDLPPSTPQKEVKKQKSEKPIVDLLTPPRPDSDQKDSTATGSAVKIEKGPSTPPQKKNDQAAVDLITPPRPDRPDSAANQPTAKASAKAKSKPEIKAKAAPIIRLIGEARAASPPRPQEPHPQLRAPCFKRGVSPSSPPPQAKRRRMIPPGPETVEPGLLESEPVRGEEPQNPPQKRPRLDDSSCNVDAADWAEHMLVAPLLEDCEDPDMITDTSRARQRVQKRTKTERQLEEEALRDYLSQKGVQYAVWLQFHRKHCAIPKAGLCKHGGFVRFQVILRTGEKLDCKACLELVDNFDISLVETQRLLCAAPLPIEDVKRQQEQGEDEVEMYDAEQELKMAKDLIKSMAPIIQLVENDTTKGYKLAFRCTVCCTRGQPEGKLNTVARPRLNPVRHFLSQHLKCPTHKRNAREYQLEQQAAEAQKKDCPGLCVNECEASLGIIQEEYRLWATHTLLNSKTGEHQYWTELSTDKWFVRHKSCKGKVDNHKLTCCKLCHSLGEPRGIKRYVCRFMFKMHSAHLLCHNLFMGPEAAEGYKKKVLETEFGKRHKEHMDKIFDLKMPELQKLVRHGFSTVPGERMTSAMKNFTATTVAPCLRVHVGSLDPEVPSFVSHFLATLQSRDMSEMPEIKHDNCQSGSNRKTGEQPGHAGHFGEMYPNT